MAYHHYLLKRLIFCTLIVLQLNLHIVDAKCKGSVVFFWKETRADRLDTKRNWGVLEKEIKGNRSKLSVYMDTDNTYAFKVVGDCCWEIYNEEKYEGESRKLIPKINSGFAGIKGFPKFKAKSLKQVDC